MGVSELLETHEVVPAFGGSAQLHSAQFRPTAQPRLRHSIKFVLTFFVTAPEHQGIFGVPLQESIRYANVAISLYDDDGNSYIYGYVPIVVAKCGVFLKEKGMLALT